MDPEEININVKATLNLFSVCVCSEEKVITDVKIKGNYLYELWREISNNVVHVCGTSKNSDQPVHVHSLARAFAICLNII